MGAGKALSTARLSPHAPPANGHHDEHRSTSAGTARPQSRNRPDCTAYVQLVDPGSPLSVDHMARSRFDRPEPPPRHELTHASPTRDREQRSIAPCSLT